MKSRLSLRSSKCARRIDEIFHPHAVWLKSDFSAGQPFRRRVALRFTDREKRRDLGPVFGADPEWPEEKRVRQKRARPSRGLYSRQETFRNHSRDPFLRVGGQ